jgi:hypothetical protein
MEELRIRYNTYCMNKARVTGCSFFDNYHPENTQMAEILWQNIENPYFKQDGA